MKLSALYTIWNGLELLEQSIKQIEPFCDHIIVGWQLYSNKGEKSIEIEAFIERLGKNNKIHLVEFKPVSAFNTKRNELEKHNQLLEYARGLGSTHFFLSACDHFYDPEQFEKMKEGLKGGHWDTTFTGMYTYYKHPTWRMDPPEEYYMPFICKLQRDTKFVFDTQYPVYVDPSVKVYPIGRFRIFNKSQIVMHHYSMLRKDINNKFTNAAASIRWPKEKLDAFLSEYETAKPGATISYFGGRKIIEVPNVLNISY